MKMPKYSVETILVCAAQDHPKPEIREAARAWLDIIYQAEQKSKE